MPKFDVTELSRGDDLSQWDELVDLSLHGTIFHKTGWLNACASSMGKRVKIFGCFQDGLLVGGCSLFVEKRFGVIPIASSTCEMTPYGGFVLSPIKSLVHRQEIFDREIIEFLINYIERSHFYSISVRGPPEFRDIRPFIWKGWRSDVFYTYYFSLEENIESHIDRSISKHVRKAIKNGIIIEPSSDISKYYTLLCDTYTRKNKKNPQKSLISELYSFIKDNDCGEMLFARTPEDEIACARIIIWDKHRAYGWTAASDKRFLKSRAINLLTYETFKMLKERGIPMMNLMMGNVPSLADAAAKLNPMLVPYYNVHSSIFDNILSLKKK
jgi:hypothetical protein